MSEIERFDVLVFGSGAGGKLAAWTSASEGLRTAVIERRYIVGSCPESVRSSLIIDFLHALDETDGFPC